MLTLKFIQENKDEVIEALKIKNFDAKNIIEEVIQLDIDRKKTQGESDNAKSEMNSLSKKIGLLFKEGKAEEANQAKAQTAELKEKINQFNTELSTIENKLTDLLLQIPNIPNPSVPAGKGEEDNQVEKECGEIPTLHKNALPHWDLATKYDLIDFELGVKITGAGFPVYKGKGARLQRALINFFLDEAQKGWL